MPMTLLFDLDGTLTDPAEGITMCVRHALTELGRTAPPANELLWCIGPPLRQSFVTLLGPENAHLADAAMEKYRDRFRTIGLFENTLYPGIKNVLEALRQSGNRLMVATSKPTVFATRIVEHFGLTECFESIDGSELDGTRADKSELIRYLLQRDGIPCSEAVMIGDREHDMIGARKNGVPGMGVLWGYGSRTELENAGARLCVETPQGLITAVQAMCSGRPVRNACAFLELDISGEVKEGHAEHRLTPTIRQATHEDIPALAALNADAQGIHVALFPWAFKETDPEALASRFRELLTDPSVQVFVAEQAPGGTVTGYAVFRAVERGENIFQPSRAFGYVDQIGVAQDCRGQGIGRALIDRAIAETRRLGMSRLELDAWEDNVPAVRAFEALGFKTSCRKMAMDV